MKKNIFIFMIFILLPVLLPGLISAQGFEREFRLQKKIFIGLQAADLATTEIGFRHGASEANLIMAKMDFGKMAAIKAVYVFGSLVALNKIKKQSPKIAVWVLRAVNLAYIGIVANNALVIHGRINL